MTSRPDRSDDELSEDLRASRVLEDAPEALVQRAIDLWQPRARAAGQPGRLRRLVATLGFDSAGLAPAAAGVRSGPRLPGQGARQLLFSTEGWDIDVRLARAPDGLHWQISGQVLGPEVQGVALLRCGEFSAEAPWNELAEFHFDAVPAGPCSLTLRAADWELELPSLDFAS